MSDSKEEHALPPGAPIAARQAQARSQRPTASSQETEQEMSTVLFLAIPMVIIVLASVALGFMHR